MITIKEILKKIQTLPTRDINNRAAVLIPIIKKTDETLHLLFQVRSASLKWQPSQICFPGGHVEEQDATMINTAIRETQEELGINKNSIKIYGQLPAIQSNFELRIYPIIGELTSQNYQLNHDEVESIFTVPLDWFINNKPILAKIDLGTKASNDFPFDLIPSYDKKWTMKSQYPVYIYHYKNHVIWGLTAQIIYQFLDFLAIKEI